MERPGRPITTGGSLALADATAGGGHRGRGLYFVVGCLRPLSRICLGAGMFVVQLEGLPRGIRRLEHRTSPAGPMVVGRPRCMVGWTTGWHYHVTVVYRPAVERTTGDGYDTSLCRGSRPMRRACVRGVIQLLIDSHPRNPLREESEWLNTMPAKPFFASVLSWIGFILGQSCIEG